MDADEKLMQKALGLYPTIKCKQCGKLVYEDTAHALPPSMNHNIYLICTRCYDKNIITNHEKFKHRFGW